MAPLRVKVGTITIGSLTVAMEETPLVEIATALGGQISNEGEAGEHMVWTCDGTGQSTIWFMSDGEMGDGKLTIFAVEAKAPRVEWNCSRLPAEVSINAGVPGLGAPSDEVRSMVVRRGRAGRPLSTPARRRRRSSTASPSTRTSSTRNTAARSSPMQSNNSAKASPCQT